MSLDERIIIVGKDLLCFEIRNERTINHQRQLAKYIINYSTCGVEILKAIKVTVDFTAANRVFVAGFFTCNIIKWLKWKRLYVKEDLMVESRDRQIR